MAKKKIVEKETMEVILDTLMENASIEVSLKLYNQTKKYKFEMTYKYNHVYLTVIRKNTSDHHIGTFKFNNVDEIKGCRRILRYLQLEDVEEFFKNFKY